MHPRSGILAGFYLPELPRQRRLLGTGIRECKKLMIIKRTVLNLRTKEDWIGTRAVHGN